ncbi:8552_t:CDS:2, partial [Funneliformis mosseae]
REIEFCPMFTLTGMDHTSQSICTHTILAQLIAGDVAHSHSIYQFMVFQIWYFKVCHPKNSTWIYRNVTGIT